MNNENPAAPSVAEDIVLTFVDPSVGKIENADDNSLGKLLGLSNTSKKSLEKTAVFVVTNQTVESSAPAAETTSIPAPQGTPLPIPAMNELPVLNQPVQPVIPAPVVEQPLPVSVNPEVGELNKPIDVTEVPLLNGELPKSNMVETNVIPEPMPLSQENNSNNNINVEQVAPAMPIVPEVPSEAVAQPVLPPAEPVVALEPSGVNNDLFVNTPEVAPADSAVVNAVDQAVADIQTQVGVVPENNAVVEPQAEENSTPAVEIPAEMMPAPTETSVEPVQSEVEQPVLGEEKIPVLNGVPSVEAASVEIATEPVREENSTPAVEIPAEMMPAPTETTVESVQSEVEQPVLGTTNIPVLDDVPSVEAVPVETATEPVQSEVEQPVLGTTNIPVLDNVPSVEAVPVETATEPVQSEAEQPVLGEEKPVLNDASPVEVASVVPEQPAETLEANKTTEIERFSIERAKEEMFGQIEKFCSKIQEEVDKYVSENKDNLDNQAITQVVQDGMSKIADTVSQPNVELTEPSNSVPLVEQVMPQSTVPSSSSLGM